MNKKAQLYTEIIPAILLVIGMGLILFLSYSYVSNSKADIEKSAPNATEKFPAAFVHSFLYFNISSDDAKSVGLEDDRKYLVKDLLWLNTKESRDLAEKYRTSYLEKINNDKDSSGYNMHYYYKKFSKDDYDEDNLIHFNYDLKTTTNLEGQISVKNYAFYMKDQNSNLVHVFFKEPRTLRSPSSTSDVTQTQTSETTDSGNEIEGP